MELVDWQMNWKHWHLTWETNFYPGSECIIEDWIFIGPIQMRFWSYKCGD